VPWKDLCALIAPVYSKLDNGRPRVGVERMLRTYFLQQWLDLSGRPAVEALYETFSMCWFTGIDLGRYEPAPDETTVCKFHHLFEPWAGRCSNRSTCIPRRAA